MKEKLILTEKQKELVEQFKNLLNEMRNEKIGMVAEVFEEAHYQRTELYLNIFNANEVDMLIAPIDLEEYDGDELEETNDVIADKSNTTKIEVPIDLLIHTSNSNSYCSLHQKYGYIFKDEE